MKAMWFKAGCAALVLGAVGLQGAAAATVTELIGGGGRIFISDENGEALIDRNGNGLIDVGDSIRGVLSFDQFRKDNNPQVPLLHSVGNSELGGVFQIQVISKTPNLAFPGQFDFVFGVDASFSQQFGNGNTMVVLYEDFGSTHFQINEPGTQGSSEASVTDGTLFLLLGLVDASNGWFGRGGDNPASAGSPSTRLGVSTFALSRTSSEGLGGSLLLELLTNPAGTGEFVGTSQIGGPFIGSPWPLSSESDAEFQVIPTPSAAMGGLVLMAGLLRRRARA